MFALLVLTVVRATLNEKQTLYPCPELMTASALKETSGFGVADVQRAAMITELYEAVIQRDAMHKSLLTAYVRHEQAVALLAVDVSNVILPNCISALRKDILDEMVKNKPSTSVISDETVKGIEMVETELKRLEAEKDDEFSSDISKIEKSLSSLVGYYAWDPMRKYLKSINPFIKREPFYQQTESRLALYKLLMSFRLEYALYRLDQADDAIGLILSFFASHYGFIVLTGEYFRHPTFNMLSPGDAANKSEVFAITNMSYEISWLTLSNKLIQCENSSHLDDNSKLIAEQTLKQRSMMKSSSFWKNFYFAGAAALALTSLALAVHLEAVMFDSAAHMGSTSVLDQKATLDNIAQVIRSTDPLPQEIKAVFGTMLAARIPFMRGIQFEGRKDRQKLASRIPAQPRAITCRSLPINDTAFTGFDETEDEEEPDQTGFYIGVALTILGSGICIAAFLQK